MEYRDLHGDGGILKKVFRSGDPHCGRPTIGDRVFIDYETYDTRFKKVIDSSEQNGCEETFVVGEKEHVRAWEHAVITMQLNEVLGWY
jgi:hypothetical protein